MSDELDTLMRRLADEHNITSVLHLNCHAIDCIREELRSRYWPGAQDSHGRYFGTAEGFFDSVERLVHRRA